MQGYTTLRNRIRLFLGENPDVQSITLVRPKPEPRVVHTYGSQESYARMPESCPIVHDCIDSILIDGQVITPELRELLFQAIYTRVTDKFRDQLTEVCNEKIDVLKRLRDMKREIAKSIEKLECVDTSPTEKKKSRADVVVTVDADAEIVDEDDSEY